MSLIISITINPSITILFFRIMVVPLIVCNKLFEKGEGVLLIKFTLGIILVFGIGIFLGRILHIDRHLK
jgi:hypothetical protein